MHCMYSVMYFIVCCTYSQLIYLLNGHMNLLYIVVLYCIIFLLLSRLRNSSVHKICWVVKTRIESQPVLKTISWLWAQCKMVRSYTIFSSQDNSITYSKDYLFQIINANMEVWLEIFNIFFYTKNWSWFKDSRLKCF